MSVRFITFLVCSAALGASGCKDANNGQSSANEFPVADGQIVLLKRSNEVAAFVLKNQRISPETTDYSWAYRSDGKGSFSPGDPAVSTGTSTNATRISFSTFSVEWSIAKDGFGWVYFSVGAMELGKAANFAMCVTSETNLVAMDANDRRWVYRGRPRVNIRALLKSQVPDGILTKKQRVPTASTEFTSRIFLIIVSLCTLGILVGIAVRRNRMWSGRKSKD